VRKKMFFCVVWISQGRKKISYNTEPNEPTMEESLSYVLLESTFASLSTVGKGHPSLVSLVMSVREGAA
jgi:hypothetical protein